MFSVQWKHIKWKLNYFKDTFMVLLLFSSVCRKSCINLYDLRMNSYFSNFLNVYMIIYFNILELAYIIIFLLKFKF